MSYRKSSQGVPWGISALRRLVSQGRSFLSIHVCIFMFKDEGIKSKSVHQMIYSGLQVSKNTDGFYLSSATFGTKIPSFWSFISKFTS